MKEKIKKLIYLINNNEEKENILILLQKIEEKYKEETEEGFFKLDKNLDKEKEKKELEEFIALQEELKKLLKILKRALELKINPQKIFLSPHFKNKFKNIHNIYKLVIMQKLTQEPLLKTKKLTPELTPEPIPILK